MSYPRFFAQQGERLIDNGFYITPIRAGEKRPRIDAWQETHVTKDDVKRMGANGSAYDGVGILTSYSPAVDLDIYEPTASQIMSDWLDANVGLGLIRQGQFPKQLTVFRTDTPFTKVFSASYRIPGTTQDSRVEILGHGQQFVAYGIHPDTQQAYVWPDESVLERPWHSLPVLTQETARQICEAFEAMALAAGWPRTKNGNWNNSHETVYSDDPLDRKAPREDVTDEQIREALAMLDPDDYAEYSQWVRVGQMLHHQYRGSAEGLAIFDEWSQTLDKYEGFDAVENKWTSFNEYRNAGTVTIGSLLHEAKQVREAEEQLAEKIRTENDAFLYREIAAEIASFSGDWFDFKSGEIPNRIRRFIGNVADAPEAERYLSKIGKTVADRRLEGAPGKATIEKELKPAFRRAGIGSGAVATVRPSLDNQPIYETNRDGAIVPSQSNANLAMRSGGYAWFGFDEFQAQVLVSVAGTNHWRPLEDNDYPRALVFMEAQGFSNISKEKIKDAIAVVAEEHRFDSARDWGKALVWDRVERIRTFGSTYLGLPDDDYHQAVWYYAWTGMAARLLSPGVKMDMVPVLVSEEGMKKSEFVEALAPIAESFGVLDLSRKDDDLSRSMRGKLVMEWAEMKGLKGRDEETIKAFVTQKFQEWIPKYKEQTLRYYRRYFTIGTANDMALLPAQGKNRRWLPMTLTQPIDLDAVKRDREQLWAEAIEIYKAYGVQWERAHVLAPAEREKYREEDPLGEFISDWLDSASYENNGDGSQTRGDLPFRILELMTAVNDAGHKNATPEKVGKRLRSLGYENRNARVGHRVIRAWVRKS